MNKQMTSLIAIVLILLTGCGASGPKLASSAEDIAGTWRSTVSGMEVQLTEDGIARHQHDDGETYHQADEFYFDGTRFFFKGHPGSACTLDGYEPGIYEVELLENGNLKFTVTEDECLVRVNLLAGRLIEVEWEPVP